MENPNTKERILLTAVKAFLRSGYRDVSINEVVNELGITKGAFYHYFDSKDDLLVEIIEEYCFSFLYEFEELMSDLQTDIKKNIEQAASLIISKLDFNKQEGIEYGSFLLLIYDSMKRFNYIKERGKTLYMKIYNLILAKLRLAQQTNMIKPELDHEALTLALITMIEGIFFMSEIFDTELLKEKVPAMVNNFWQQIAN